MTRSQITENEISNSQHVLRLLQNQVKAGRIDSDYMQRQLGKISSLLARVAESHTEQAQGGRFEALYNVSRILGTSLDLQVVLDQVMDAVIQLTGAERGFLMLRDDDGELMVHVARNLDQRTISSEEFQYSRTISNYVLDRGETVLTTNAVEDPRFSDKASIVRQSLRSIMAAPLRARGNVIGVAYVENRVIAGLFNDEDRETLEAFSGQASVAIDNAMLFEVTDAKLSRRVEELRQLRRIDMKLNEKLDPDQAMLYALQAACQVAGATRGHLGLLEGDTADKQRVVASHHYSDGAESDQSRVYLDDMYHQVRDVIRDAEPVIFDTGQYGLMTVMIAPILRENDTIGVVALIREDGNSFTPEEQEMVARVISRAAVTIENARLYAAVQAADRAKSEFVGIVAHDLKAPMTSIAGYADLLLMDRDSLEERQIRFLHRISDTVDRMEMLVSDLADISRIESGEFLMKEMRVTVNSVVEAIRDTTMPDMQARDHTYIEEIMPDLPEMWVDYYRLIQVLTNFITNACKYTPDGGKIRLYARQDGDRIRFEVQDNGIGLTEDGVQKLGTKFWRAEDEFTRSQPGTGLGFAITTSLVEQMGSHIEVDSTPGEGSRFAFTVPIATHEHYDEMPPLPGVSVADESEEVS